MAGPLMQGTGHIVFGSTEVEPISGITASEFLGALAEPKETRPPGLCVGRPVPQLQLRVIEPVDGSIASADLDTITKRNGEIGEIIVSGAHVLPSYLNDPQANRDTIVLDGERMWRRTGDCGALDREGRLWLVGRLSQRIQTGRGTIWPIPVELAALGCPVVKHAALVGRTTPGSKWATPILCVETDAAISNQERAEIAQAVADWDVSEIVDLRSIPRDPRHHSKTDVRALRRAIGA
jgi:acyl-CoA synthetase (AMP-forming)/AMP-acid ligase II